MDDRLTERKSPYAVVVRGCSTVYSVEERKGASLASAVARLAKYEDTGLTPGEIQTLIAERDALLEALHGSCRNCTYYSWKIEETPCQDCYYCSIHFNEPPNADSGLSDNWQWRGIGENDGT